jgi:protein O-GlcNAc transferase
VNLGNLLADAQRKQEAEAEYRKALQVEPSDADARYNLSLLLEEEDRLPEALRELRRTAELAGDDREVLQTLARVLERAGDHRGAAVARDRAARIDPPAPPMAATTGESEQG